MSVPPTVAQSTTSRSFEVRWMSPSSGTWVASRRGQTAGTVERVDGRYRAANARGRTLGWSDDLDSARAAIDRRLQRDSGGSANVVTVLLGGVIGGAVATALVLVVTIARMGA